MLTPYIYHALLLSKCVGKNRSIIFLCLQGLLVFLFYLGLVVSVTVILEEELVES
jgi:hypothetical protein